MCDSLCSDGWSTALDAMLCAAVRSSARCVSGSHDSLQPGEPATNPFQLAAPAKDKGAKCRGEKGTARRRQTLPIVGLRRRQSTQATIIVRPA